MRGMISLILRRFKDMKVKLKDFVVPTLLEQGPVWRPDLGEHKTEDLVFIRSLE